jgi:predicted ester cyclase
MTMDIEANKAVVRRFIEEIVNTGDVSRLDEVVSPDYVEVHANKMYDVGLEGARDHVLGVRKTYPDLHLTIEQQIAEGEWVATRITARGTHTGEWLGIRPTSKKLEFTGVNLDRVVGGRIVEHGGAADMLTPLLEAGALRVVGEDQ